MMNLEPGFVSVRSSKGGHSEMQNLRYSNYIKCKT